MFANRRILIAGLGLLLGVSAQTVLGSTLGLPDCSLGGCDWSMSVDGVQVNQGTYSIDSTTGNIIADPVTR